MTDRSPDVLEVVEKINAKGEWVVSWDEETRSYCRKRPEWFLGCLVSQKMILYMAKQIQEQNETETH